MQMRMYHMEDVLEVYQRPYDPDVPKICMDEGSKQLLAHTRKPIAMEAGEAGRVDYEYERKGVCSVFVAVEPETGACVLRTSERRTRKGLGTVSARSDGRSLPASGENRAGDG
jgi:hypothetical protein